MTKVESGKLADYKPQNRNLNKHSQRGMGALESSMRKHGYVAPITVAADGEAIDGSARLETVGNVFEDDVIVVHHDGTRPVIMVRDDIKNASTNEARAISANANAIAAINLVWDTEELFADMQSGVDFSDAFNQEELDAMLAGLVEKEPVQDPGADISKADELQKKWETSTGQLWAMGEHRLICGDCTDKATVERLMGGEKAQMMFTDPPYGVNYTGGHFHSGDVNIKREREELSGDKSPALYGDFLPVVLPFVDGPCYMWFADRAGKPVYDAVIANGCEIHAMIIWHKINATYAAMNAQYKQRHEPLLYFKPKGSTLRWCGPTDECTIWEVKRDAQNEYHPTQKPVELAHRAIGNHTSKTVADFFLGSGSTLIACEQTNRRCIASEISPAYVAVALERWHVATGQMPVLMD